MVIGRVQLQLWKTKPIELDYLWSADVSIC